MSYNTIRLLWAIPTAIIAASLAQLWPAVGWFGSVLAAAVGFGIGFVVAGIVQERGRKDGNADGT